LEPDIKLSGVERGLESIFPKRVLIDMRDFEEPPEDCPAFSRSEGGVEAAIHVPRDLLGILGFLCCKSFLFFIGH
jgi:hypothetical protein